MIQQTFGVVDGSCGMVRCKRESLIPNKHVIVSHNPVTWLPHVTPPKHLKVHIIFRYLSPGEKGHRKRHLATLELVLIKAPRIITGAYKAMSSPALNIEAGILPFKLHFKLLIGESLLRLATSAKYLQFTKTRSKHRLRKVTPLRSPCCQIWASIENYSRVDWKNTLFITPPWADVPKIQIEEDKTQAKTSHERLLSMPNTTSASYYTDESGINQKVGAAAVQIGHNSQNVSVFLGSISCYTVYAAELSGILVVLHIAAANRSTSQKVLIFSG